MNPEGFFPTTGPASGPPDGAPAWTATWTVTMTVSPGTPDRGLPAPAAQLEAPHPVSHPAAAAVLGQVLNTRSLPLAALPGTSPAGTGVPGALAGSYPGYTAADITGYPAIEPEFPSADEPLFPAAIEPVFPVADRPPAPRRRDVVRQTRRSVATAIMPRERARRQRVPRLVPAAFALAFGTAVLVAGSRAHMMGDTAAGFDNDRVLASFSRVVHP